MVILDYVHMAPDELDQFRFLDRKLPTYPFPNPKFCPKWDANVDVNVELGEG